MGFFPMFTEIGGRTVILVGGGRVALEKARRLLPFGPTLRVIAPECLPELAALPGICWERTVFEPALLDGEDPVFAVAATGDSQVNRAVAEACRARRIPVNVVDDPALCGFQFPALLVRGSLTVGVSTGGKSPTAAAALRDRIARDIPEDIEPLLEEMDRLRRELKRTAPDPAVRKRLLRQAWEDLQEERTPEG